MTNIMTEEEVITLGAATEAILKHLYEEACSKHKEDRSFESFFDHVIMRGKAEIERTWKSAEKTERRNAQAKTAAERLLYINLKLKNGAELTPEEKYFHDVFTKVTM